MYKFVVSSLVVLSISINLNADGKMNCTTKLGAITSDFVKETVYKKPDAANERIRTAVQINGFQKVAVNLDVTRNHNKDYSNELDMATVSDQKVSGRCWIFGACNPIRHFLLSLKKTAKDFEFSTNQVHFFNMLEKSNKYLVNVILETMNKNPDFSKEETRKQLDPSKYIADGGWFEYFSFLVSKHGLVPKSVMPETISSEATATMLSEIRLQAAMTAQKIIDAQEKRRREMEPIDLAAIDGLRNQGMKEITQILQTHLGIPPEKFSYKNKEYTPQSFAKDFAGFDRNDYVAIANFEPLQQGKVYEVVDSAIGVGDESFNLKMLATSSQRMMELVKASIDAKRAPWFAAAMGRDVDNTTGIMKKGLFQREGTYGFVEQQPLTRKQANALSVLTSNHAMAFTGYDQPDKSKPIIKLKVDNSWGEKAGDKGVYHMYADWFEQNVFQVIIHKSLLTPEELKIWESPTEKIKDEELF